MSAEYVSKVNGKPIAASVAVPSSTLSTSIDGKVSKSGDTMSGRLTLQKTLSQVITGTGTAASSSSGKYYPAKWKYDLGVATPTAGDQMVIKLPVAGHDYGVYISTDNGTTYFPVARHTGASRLTTQYPNGAYVCVVFEAYVSGSSAAGQVNDIFPLAGGTARTNLTTGCWRVINDYDSGNTICQLRTENGRFYAGSTGCNPYSLVCLDKDGKYSMLVSAGSGTGTSKTINTTGKFKLAPVILYYSANNTTAANALVSSTYATFFVHQQIDTRYSHNYTTAFTTNSPLYIECSIDDDGYWSPTTKCITQTLAAGNYYIYLGQTYSTAYQVSLSPEHPVYYYDGTNLVDHTFFSEPMYDAKYARNDTAGDGWVRLAHTSSGPRQNTDVNAIWDVVYANASGGIYSEQLFLDVRYNSSGKGVLAQFKRRYIDDKTSSVKFAVKVTGVGGSGNTSVELWAFLHKSWNGLSIKQVSGNTYSLTKRNSTTWFYETYNAVGGTTKPVEDATNNIYVYDPTNETVPAGSFVPTTRKVNGHALSADVTVTAADVSAVRYDTNAQGLNDTQKSNARTNIGAGTSNLALGTTSTTAAKGNHTHTTSIASDSSSGTVVTLSHNTQYKLTAGGTSVLFKTPTDSNTDTKVTQTKDDSGTTAYPLLMAGATDPNGTATTARYDSGVKLTPNTNTISANISGNAATSTKPSVTLLDNTKDLNDYKGSSQGDVLWYRWGNTPPSHAPISNASAVMQVVKEHDQAYCRQIVYVTGGQVFTRKCKAGTWDNNWSDEGEVSYENYSLGRIQGTTSEGKYYKLVGIQGQKSTATSITSVFLIDILLNSTVTQDMGYLKVRSSCTNDSTPTYSFSAEFTRFTNTIQKADIKVYGDTSTGVAYVYAYCSGVTSSDWGHVGARCILVSDLYQRRPIGAYTTFSNEGVINASAPSLTAVTVNTNILVKSSDLGSAAYKDVPTSGNASATQVVMGNDTRLTNSRTPTSHTHGNIANGGTLTDTAAAAVGNDYVVIRDADNAKIQTSTIKGTDVADAVSKKHSHSTLTLSTTAQAYDDSHTLALPSTDPYTSARTPASHTHGNITNGGTITSDTTVASGDKIVIIDADNNKVARSGIAFDNSTTTKALTQKGTFESFAKSGDITTAIQALDVTSVGGDGKYISAISETDGKISATATTMDTTPTASSTKAVTSGGIRTALDEKVNKTVVTLLDDWNTLNTTGIYEVESQAKNVAHSPESGKVACYVTVVDGYITQLAVGDKVRKRCMPATTQVWENWVVLQDSSGLTVNELYTSSPGGYIDIHGATIEAGGPAGTTEISGDGITTPKVNGIALGPLTDTAAAIPASSNDKLNDVTHLLVNGNKTLKLSEMVENKSYVFHVVSSSAVVSVYNDSSSAYTIRHRGSNIPVAKNSSAPLNSSTDPAGEIWLARVGSNIYMSKSCEAGTVKDSLKWNGYSLSLGGTPTAGSGTIYFT